MPSRRSFIGLAGALGVGAFLGLRIDRDPDYERLIRLWRRRLELEKELFRRLRFTLSPTQMRCGMTLKLVLRDQLGDDWLFKMGDTAVDGAEAIYRIGCLFGWETPELHRATLPINGPLIFGSAQRLIPESTELAIHIFGPNAEPARLTDEVLEYLLTAQLLGWITANHHVHSRQFVTTRVGDSIDRIYRIDNTVEWFLVGHDELSAKYCTPLLSRKLPVSKLGYGWMWGGFRASKLDLPLARAHALARFIAGFPDEVFAESFLSGIENRFRYFPNVDQMTLSLVSSTFLAEGNEELFLQTLLARKRRLAADIEVLFDEQLSLRGVEREYRNGPSPRVIGRQLSERLEIRITELEERAKELPPRVSPQEPIRAITSFAAYSVLKLALSAGDVSRDRAIPVERFEATIEELHGMFARAEDPHERAGIDVAIDALRGEIENPKTPLEYLSYIVHLNSLFPVLPGAVEGAHAEATEGS
ncbi:MAG: hypothetical protein CME06_11335 [Gemmatimonadetes bacterium]|nr:hypothetical protein [Gemmatimonadota bacterium]